MAAKTKPIGLERIFAGQSGFDIPAAPAPAQAPAAQQTIEATGQAAQAQQAEEAYRNDLGLDSLIPTITPEEQARRQRSAQAVQSVAALGNGISALSNLIFTGQGAPTQALPSAPDESGQQMMTWQDRLKNDRLQRDALDNQRQQQQIANAYQEWQKRNTIDQQKWQRQNTLDQQRQQQANWQKTFDYNKQRAEKQDEISNRELDAREYSNETQRIIANKSSDKPVNTNLDGELPGGHRYNSKSFDLGKNKNLVSSLLIEALGEERTKEILDDYTIDKNSWTPDDVVNVIVKSGKTSVIQRLVDKGWLELGSDIQGGTQPAGTSTKPLIL